MRNKLDQEIKKRMRYGIAKPNQVPDAKPVGKLNWHQDKIKVCKSAEGSEDMCDDVFSQACQERNDEAFKVPANGKMQEGN